MAVSAIELAEAEGLGIALSSVSLYEIACIYHRGRVELKGSGEELFDHLYARFLITLLGPSVAHTSARLASDCPGDPMDRIITSTALAENIPLVTADQHICRSRVANTIW
jgi:PIN domain nuclease of toxin-antitoxin system